MFRCVMWLRKKIIFAVLKIVTMAKSSKKDDSILDVDVEEVYSKAEDWITRNKKSIFIGVGALVVLIAGISIYNYSNNSNNAEASNLIWKAEYYYSVDSLDLAIDGTDDYAGFEEIAANYGGTKTGELAKYYLGLCYRDKGEFKQAVDYFLDCSLSSDLLSAMAFGNEVIV